jgi:hypothetical protein
VLAGDALLVASFERKWMYPPDSIRGAEIIARWVDGEPAGIERATDAGCARSVAVPITPVGDLMIRYDYKRVADAISDSCSSTAAKIPASVDKVDLLKGTEGLAPRESFKPRGDIHSSLAPWLIALAIIAAIAELFVRRRRRIHAADSRQSTSSARRAA